jgi:phthalate 4,5-cis-dihydrodiol dehydrogenase
VGAWDRARPTEGAYAAQLSFDDGTFASLTYSGYGHFDSDEFVGWIGEFGQRKNPAHYGSARALLGDRGSPADEVALKESRAYGGGSSGDAPPVAHNHFGVVVVSCDRADLRPMANGVMIYDDTRAWLDPIAPPAIPRGGVVDEFCDAVAGRRPALHTGEWAMATLEVCLGMLESARSGSEVPLVHQVGVPGLIDDD